jgi:exodeoxyribonuclease-5
VTLKPSDAQWEAIKKIVAWYRGGKRTPQVFYLAGYAGTGKSTIFRLVLKELIGCGLRKHALATFTGKAASVLRKKGNYEAQTIHSLVYRPVGDDDGETQTRGNDEPVFDLWEDGPASEVDLIALDECSMVDDEMAEDILWFEKKVLVMGDPASCRRSRARAGLATSRS